MSPITALIQGVLAGGASYYYMLNIIKQPIEVAQLNAIFFGIIVSFGLLVFGFDTFTEGYSGIGIMGGKYSRPPTEYLSECPLGYHQMPPDPTGKYSKHKYRGDLMFEGSNKVYDWCMPDDMIHN